MLELPVIILYDSSIYSIPLSDYYVISEKVPLIVSVTVHTPSERNTLTFSVAMFVLRDKLSISCNNLLTETQRDRC